MKDAAASRAAAHSGTFRLEEELRGDDGFVGVLLEEAEVALTSKSS